VRQRLRWARPGADSAMRPRDRTPSFIAERLGKRRTVHGVLNL
jgi:hypothetical protein